VKWTSDMTGHASGTVSLTSADFILPVHKHAVVVHLSDGTRAGFGFIAQKDASPFITGQYFITETATGTKLRYSLTGLPVSSQGEWHVHEGKDCDKELTEPEQDACVGSAYSKNLVSNSLWKWSSDIDGKAIGTVDLQGYSDVANRALVVQLADGTRAGFASIGELVAPSGKFEYLQAGDTTGSGSSATGSQFKFELSGLEPSTRGGWHVHAGTECEKQGTIQARHECVGGLYYAMGSQNVWAPVHWVSNADGKASGFVDLSSFPLDVNKHAIVVHLSDGTRASMASIQADPTGASVVMMVGEALDQDPALTGPTIVSAPTAGPTIAPTTLRGGVAHTTTTEPEECAVDMGDKVPCWAAIIITVVAAIAAAAALLVLMAYLLKSAPGSPQPLAVSKPTPAAAVRPPLHLHWGIHGHTNACPTASIREFAKELSMSRATAVKDEIQKYSDEKGSSGRGLDRSTITAFGHGDEKLLVLDGEHPDSKQNMRVELTLENPAIFREVIDQIARANPGWSPEDGFHMIGCPNVAVREHVLTHQKLEFKDHSHTITKLEAVHELATFVRYLDLEAHKVDTETKATPFKNLHRVHDHLGHLTSPDVPAKLDISTTPASPTVKFNSLETALDSAASE
jgi:hypothetical protein